LRRLAPTNKIICALKLVTPTSCGNTKESWWTEELRQMKRTLRSSSEKLKEKADKTSGASRLAKIPNKPKMTPPPISQMVLPRGTKKTQP
jgi:hypothetical protein